MRFIRLGCLGGFICVGATTGLAQTSLDHIRIGPVPDAWTVSTLPHGEQKWKQVLDPQGHFCTLVAARARDMASDAAADYADQWRHIAPPSVAAPEFKQNALPSGWVSLFGERAGRKDGKFRLLGLQIVSNGKRAQSLVASTNDERCVPLFKALVSTITVLGEPAATDAAGPASPSSAPVPNAAAVSAPARVEPAAAGQDQRPDASQAAQSAPRWPGEDKSAFPVITGDGLYLALNRNGTVSEFGDDTYLPFGDGSEPQKLRYRKPKLIPRVSGVVGIAANDDHAVMVMADGSVRAWGEACAAAGTDKPPQVILSPQRIEGLSGVAQVFVGQHVSGAVLRNGGVALWGERFRIRLATGESETIGGGNCRAPQILAVRDVRKVESNTDHALALLGNGTVVAWGSNRVGQIGDGSTRDPLQPIVVKGLTDIVDIAAGDGYSYALQRDGRVWQWGHNAGPSPQPVKSLGKAVALWGKLGFALALTADGTLWGWGEAFGGVLGDGSFDHKYAKPVKAGLTLPFTAIHAVQGAVFAWRPDGTLIGFGAHGYTPQGAPRTGYSVVPEPLLKWDAPDQWALALRHAGDKAGAVSK